MTRCASRCAGGLRDRCAPETWIRLVCLLEPVVRSGDVPGSRYPERVKEQVLLAAGLLKNTHFPKVDN